MTAEAGREGVRTESRSPVEHPDPYSSSATAYIALVARELDRPVDPRVTAMAAVIAAPYGHAARAILFYGSCLRSATLDGQMLDFYLIVSRYRDAYGKGWFAFANRVLPPNVFLFEHAGLAAKYAVLSEADFARMTSVSAREPSVLARFAQPSRLVWAADGAARETAIASVARAAPALLALVRPLMADDAAADPLAIWRKAFALTYTTELRAERSDRSGSIVDADPGRYRQFAATITAMTPAAALTDAEFRADTEARWARFRRRGKRLTLLRLAKATTTFAGGIDYIAWKINRHADAGIVIRPWQRRHPVLGAITLLPKLWRKGAVR